MKRALPLILLASIAGCVPGPGETALVPNNPFGGPLTPGLPQGDKPAASPATEEASLRVSQVGQKIVAANPQIGLKPLFSTIGPSLDGPPKEEIFHTSKTQVVITEPLVRKCKSDGELAAILCVELAKMAEKHNGPAANADDAGPPADVPVGGDARGTFGPADGTRAAELAKYDRAHHRGAYAGFDPKPLARSYLTRAGYPASDFDAAAPLMQAAEGNVTLEKQMKALFGK